MAPRKKTPQELAAEKDAAEAAKALKRGENLARDAERDVGRLERENAKAMSDAEKRFNAADAKLTGVEGVVGDALNRVSSSLVNQSEVDKLMQEAQAEVGNDLQRELPSVPKKRVDATKSTKPPAASADPLSELPSVPKHRVGASASTTPPKPEEKSKPSFQDEVNQVVKDAMEAAEADDLKRRLQGASVPKKPVGASPEPKKPTSPSADEGFDDFIDDLERELAANPDIGRVDLAANLEDAVEKLDEALEVAEEDHAIAQEEHEALDLQPGADSISPPTVPLAEEDDDLDEGIEATPYKPDTPETHPEAVAPVMPPKKQQPPAPPPAQPSNSQPATPHDRTPERAATPAREPTRSTSTPPPSAAAEQAPTSWFGRLVKAVKDIVTGLGELLGGAKKTDEKPAALRGNTASSLTQGTPERLAKSESDWSHKSSSSSSRLETRGIEMQDMASRRSQPPTKQSQVDRVDALTNKSQWFKSLVNDTQKAPLNKEQFKDLPKMQSLAALVKGDKLVSAVFEKYQQEVKKLSAEGPEKGVESAPERRGPK